MNHVLLFFKYICIRFCKKNTCLHTMASRIRICIRILTEEEEKNRAFKHNNVQHKYINWIYN